MYWYEYASQFPRVVLFMAVFRNRSEDVPFQLLRIWQIRDIGRSLPQDRILNL